MIQIFDRDRWQEIWVTISRNKTRSFLTCFGVFWGTFILVVLASFGAGFKNTISDSLGGFSTNAIFLSTAPTSLPYHGFKQGRNWTFRERDINAIMRDVPEIRIISPFIWSEDDNITYNNKRSMHSAVGVKSDYFFVEKFDVLYGRRISEIDEMSQRKVCILGSDVYERFFDKGVSPLGEFIKYKGIYFKIVGVVKKESSFVNIGGNSDNQIMIPYSTLQQLNGKGDRFDYMFAIPRGGIKKENKIGDRIVKALKENNHISPDDTQAIFIFEVSQVTQLFKSIITGSDILIWIIGLGTLLAGLIGISNIMIVTVKERTREIGVRRAIGATPRQIIIQILSESIVLTSVAGLIGITLGVSLMRLVAMGFENMSANSASTMKDPIISFYIALTATAIIIVGGLVAAILPAWYSIRINAIDAIRDE